VYALGKMKGNSSYQDAGKLLIANYAPRTQKVIFVPVAISDKDLMALPLINLDSMKKGLDAIYGKLGISFELFEDYDLEQENIEFLLEDGLDLERKGKWDILSDEMEYIKYLYSMERKVEHGAAYIFFLNKRHAADASVVGDMPRGQASGFMFVDENLELFSDARLVAHELGHGLYSLQHTFDYPALENVETDNLMDYNGGDFLAHFQWRLIQNPTLVWSFLQDDEDGWKTVSQYVLQIGDDIVWVIDGTSYETLKSKVANDCLPEVVVERVDDIVPSKGCNCECKQVAPENFNVYYFDGKYTCFINRGKIKKGEIKRMTSLILDKNSLDVNGTHLDACTHIYIRNKKCIQRNYKTGNEFTNRCKTDTLDLCQFKVRPCYSFVECKVGNETIYLKPNSSGTSEITTNSDSICLYPLFINENVLNASKINDRCKLKIEDYPYLLKEIKFISDSTSFIKSFDNSRALLKEKKDRQLDIPSKFKLTEGENTYSVNGMEVKIFKTGAGR
jgi:hypothetical protein